MSTVSTSELVLVGASLVGIVGDALFLLPQTRRDLEAAGRRGTPAQRKVAASNHRVAVLRLVLFALIGLVGIVGMALAPRSDEGAALAALGWIVAALAGIVLCLMAVFSWRDRKALLDALRSEDGTEDEPVDRQPRFGSGR